MLALRILTIKTSLLFQQVLACRRCTHQECRRNFLNTQSCISLSLKKAIPKKEITKLTESFGLFPPNPPVKFEWKLKLSLQHQSLVFLHVNPSRISLFPLFSLPLLLTQVRVNYMISNYQTFRSGICLLWMRLKSTDNLQNPKLFWSSPEKIPLLNKAVLIKFSIC